MKLALTAAVLLSLNQAAFAEAVGKSGGFDEDEITYGPPVVETKKNKVIPQATQAPKPAPKVEVAPPVDIKPRMETAAAPTIPSNVLFPVKAKITAGDCQEPIASPDASKTPVEVWVDQQTQTIKIVTPDRKAPLVDTISSGGGLKIPNGELKKDPYCARTPKIDKVVSAIEPHEFDETTCKHQTKRDMSTVFNDYKTRTFTDKYGRQVPMDDAIRIEGGIFFHTVPPSYAELMGQNVSGECIRLFKKTAVFLQAQIRKYGAIKVHISEPPPPVPGAPNYCDEEKVAQAIREKQQGSTAPTAQVTGTEDVPGGTKSAVDLFARWETSPLNLARKGGPLEFLNPDNFKPNTQANQPPRPKANVGAPARRI